jgi:hypothetical protein
VYCQDGRGGIIVITPMPQRNVLHNRECVHAILSCAHTEQEAAINPALEQPLNCFLSRYPSMIVAVSRQHGIPRE